MSYLEEARGGYIGPVDRDEALEAIRSHLTGPVIIEYPERGFAGGDRRLADGWASEVTPGVFAFSNTDVPLGVGMLYADATVLDLASPEWTAERWTGGLDLRLASSLIRLVFWHSVLHVTDSGDVAPGLGGFTIDTED